MSANNYITEANMFRWQIIPWYLLTNQSLISTDKSIPDIYWQINPWYLLTNQPLISTDKSIPDIYWQINPWYLLTNYPLIGYLVYWNLRKLIEWMDRSSFSLHVIYILISMSSDLSWGKGLWSPRVCEEAYISSDKPNKNPQWGAWSHSYIRFNSTQFSWIYCHK